MIRWIVTHSASVVLLMACVLLFGMLSYVTLPREAAPDVKIPVVLVTTPYIGVAPADVETLITIPLENELAGVKDIKKLSSTSAEGVSIVSMEFEPSVVIEDALQRVRDRVNRAKPKLPEDAEEPQVQEISFSDQPIMLVTIAGAADQERLKALAEAVEEEVGRIPGVLETRVTGGLERQFMVHVDPRRLTSYGLGIADVVNAIGQENVNIPGGDVRAGGASFLLRVPGDLRAGADIESIAVKRVGERPVFVRDLARVIDGYADVESYARMNQQPAVSLSVTKRAGASIIDIADEVKAIAARHAATWPEGVEFRILADQSKMIRNMVSDLENNIITALLLVVAVIVFFMGARNSLFVAFSIPMSMLVSFVVIDTLGMTLNMIVLFSLILALGMLVDNAIVIVENIYRHMEEGKDIVTASIDGTQEVSIAVASSTATTVAAFLPLVFWSGIMGQFMGYMPKTVIIVLVASLVVAVLMLPVITAKALKKTGGSGFESGDADARSPMMQRYRALLVFSIRNRYASAALGVASFVLTIVAYSFLNHGTEFFPATEPDRAVIRVELPDGADLEATDAVVRRIEAVLTATENVDVFVSETGVSGGGGGMIMGSQAQANAARITVDFLPHANEAGNGVKARVEVTDDTVSRLRAQLQEIPGASVEVAAEEMGPPVGQAIAIEVSGPEFHAVGALAQKVKRRLAEVEGTTEVEDDYKVGRPEMRLRIDRGAAKRVGASTGEVANTVRTAIAGATASAIRDGSDEYDVIVSLDPSFRDSLQDVLALRIPGRTDRSPNTYQVPISAVASYELGGGEGSIRHIDQDLVVTVGGDVAIGFNENAVRESVIALIQEMKDKGEIPAGFDLRLGGANDEQRESAIFLGRAFIIAVFLIAAVLVTQFNNFRLPAIVLMSVALSLIGVLWGLVITGTSFGIMMTGLGVISLAGVVVNNAIVLLDYVEQLKERGVPTEEALIQAGMTRFRPVMLTAITTVLGLVPMALGISFDFRSLKLLVGGGTSQFWGPMAIAVIFGLAVATVLTLVMVPTLYSLQEDVGAAWARWRGRRAGSGGSKGPGLAVGAAGAALLIALLPRIAGAAPVSLEQAWEAAERQNVDLQLAVEQRTQTETLRGQAWALVQPKVSLGATYTFNQYDIKLDMAESFGFLNDAFADIYTRQGWIYEDMITSGAAGSEAAVPGSGLSYAGAAGGAVRANFQSRCDAGLISPEECAVLLEGADPSGISGEADGGDPVVIQAKRYFAWNASVIQPLFNGRSLPVLRGAYRLIDASRATEQRIRQQVRAGVAQAYYGLLLARNMEQLAQGAVQSAESHLVLAERQVAAGALDARARLQAELAVSRARRDLATARQQIDQAQTAFAQATGLPEDSELSMPPTPSVSADLSGTLDRAMTERPDVRAADLQAEVAGFYRTAKLGEWAPSVDARFTYSWSENTGFQGRNDLWMFVVEANWLLWDGGLRIAQAREEASKARQAELAAKRARQSVEQEVRIAWQQHQRAGEALAATERERALAAENLRLAERALEAGAATWLEVQDARLGAIQAEMSHMQERTNRDLAALQLLLATGAL